MRRGVERAGMPVVLGAHSPKLERVRALRTKDGRREQQAFAVEGATMLAEARAAGRVPEAVYVTEAALAGLGSATGVPDERLFVVPPRAMERISDLQTPPGIIGVFAIVLRPLEALLASGDAVLLLAGLADPGNAGTLVRTAEIFGVRRAIFGCGGVEPYQPKVVRATMGAIFLTDIGVADSANLLQAARKNGYGIVATAHGGTPLSHVRFPSKPLIAVGNESHGVASWLPECDLRVTIPQSGRGESLNAAVAGGIILYAFAQQRRALTGDSNS